MAALTAWRESPVLHLFAQASLHEDFESDVDKQDRHSVLTYAERKEKLWNGLHDFFQYQTGQIAWGEPPSSVFSTGDVDIFLQASPLTRNLLKKLQDCGMDSDLRNRIESFIGGCGFLQEDMHRLVGNLKFPRETRRDNTRQRRVYTLTMSALSFMTTSADPIRDYDQCSDAPWPRNTQIIRLSEKADLLGGLLDFDISLVSCAYDSNHMRVTPRAAYSLLTLTQIVTPFIMEEKRNWQRIVKVRRAPDHSFPMFPATNSLTYVTNDPTVLQARICCLCARSKLQS